MVVVLKKLSFPPPDGVRFEMGNVDALLGDELLGKGVLFVTEEQIMWLKEGGEDGFTIEYKAMTLHAISRDPNVHPRACLYVMINGKLDLDRAADNNGGGGGERMIVDGDDDEGVEEGGDDDEEDEEATTEVRFVPESPVVLEEMYKTVQDCTLLHPDATSDMSEESNEEEDEGGDGGEQNNGNDDGEGGGYEDEDEER